MLTSATVLPAAGGFWEANAGTVVAALIGLAGVLIASGFGFVQWRRSLRAQHEVEQERIKLEREKLAWEREKLELEDRLTRKRSAEEEERQQATETAEAERALQARLDTEAERASKAEQQAITYRRALIEKLRNLKILDMSKPLDLEAVYVQIQVREEEPPRFVREEEITELAQGDPDRLLRLSQERLREHATAALPPDDALRRFSRIVILGDPGAGKTTMLRHLAFRIARGEYGTPVVLPLYVELRRYVDSDLEDLLDFAASELCERYGFDDARPYIEQELSTGRAALLLDGLDEVHGGATAEAARRTYERVNDEIDRLSTRFLDAPIAVTCRRAGWLGSLSAFQTLEVLDFSWDEIQRFLENWFADVPTKAQGLRSALAGNLRMQTLAANPLMLSLIALVYERELELPERRAELYNRCSEVMLKEWDAHREIRRFSRFTTDRKADLLKEVAWCFHRQGRRYFPKDELLELIADFLPTIDLPPSDAEAILTEIAAHYGLLKEQAHGWYGFLHLTIQEYLAACAVAERGQLALDEVIRHRHDPWWEEVVLLLAGRMSDATPLLLGILGRDPAAPPPNPEEPLAADDDVFHGDLFLAARCLVGTPRVRQPWLRERIIIEVRAILLGAPYYVPVVDQAALTLAEIGGETLTAELLRLVSAPNVRGFINTAVSKALVRFGDASLAPRLLALLQETPKLNIQHQAQIAEALGALRYTPALPVLVHLLEQIESTRVDWRDRIPVSAISADHAGRTVARALGALGDQAATVPLVAMLQRQSPDKDWPVGYFIKGCLEAISLLGDKSAIPALISLLKVQRWNNTLHSRYLVNTIKELGGRPVAPQLFDVILASRTDSFVAQAIARALRDLGDPDLVPPALEALRDPQRDPHVRWLLTEALEGCENAAKEALVQMLDEPELESQVKVGIAATLGLWGHQDGISYLRAFCDDVTHLPEETHLPEDVLRRTVSALHNLGDDSTISALLGQLVSVIVDRPRMGDVWARPVAFALAKYQPEPIARSILAVLPHSSQLDEHLGEPSHWMLQLLPQLVSKSIIPDVLSYLGRSGQAWEDSYGASRLLDAVRKLADDPESVKTLLQFWRLSKPDNELGDREWTYALNAACQRARVRVFRDGRVLPIAATLRTHADGGQSR